MKSLFVALGILITLAGTAPAQLVTGSPSGDYIVTAPGPKGLVICFHGAGGSAKAWEKRERGEFTKDLVAAGYQILAPTSLNRETKQWNPALRNNPDIQNVDALLDTLKVGAETPIYLVGHSNGTGMATRFGALSKRSGQIKALVLSQGGGGLGKVRQYSKPVLLAYAENDPIVEKSKIEEAAKNGTLLKLSPKGHEFQNIAKEAMGFFEAHKGN